MKTNFYASKDLQLGEKQAKKGDVLFTVDSEHDVDRMLAGVANGAAVKDRPAVDPEPAQPAAPAAEAPAPGPKKK